MNDKNELKQEDFVGEAILKALEGNKKGMSKDSLAAIVAIENEIDVDKTLIDLLKAGEIEAKYTGDKSRVLDTDDFTFTMKTKEKESQGA